MKIFIATFILSVFAFASAYAQQNEADFLNKIKPEYKLNLSPEPEELAVEHRKKTAEEFQAEIQAFKTQKEKIESEIARLDALKTPKEDNMYVKLQLSLKYVESQISGREKLLKSN
jgi:hypothetical protein